jgi:hypothetical protein
MQKESPTPKRRETTIKSLGIKGPIEGKVLEIQIPRTQILGTTNKRIKEKATGRTKATKHEI